jgi:queuine tRNA-ribosyltransferase
MRVQNQIGADIIMAFDDCAPAALPEEGADERRVARTRRIVDHARRMEEAHQRTLRWLDRCVRAHARSADQALFGIVQGGTDLDLRRRSVEGVCAHDLPGFAIGGVAVGEGPDAIQRVVEFTAPLLPADRPRYLMGVGYERDIVMAVAAGVDMFDCVLPTRNGRNANAFTRTGPIRLRNARFADDPTPIDPTCDCEACAGGFSRGYLRHLFAAEEMLGPTLVSVHNIRHFQRLMMDIRSAIREGAWAGLLASWPCIARGPEPLPETRS